MYTKAGDDMLPTIAKWHDPIFAQFAVFSLCSIKDIVASIYFVCLNSFKESCICPQLFVVKEDRLLSVVLTRFSFTKAMLLVYMFITAVASHIPG